MANARFHKEMTKSQEVSCVGRGGRGGEWGEAMVAIASGRSLGMGVRLEGGEGRNARDLDTHEVGVGRGRENNALERRDMHTHAQTHLGGRQPGHHPHSGAPPNLCLPHLCHLQQEGIHNIACRA